MCALVGDYFTDERYHLLSCCGMVNTHSAAGRMLMMNLANFNEFERAMISERTRETLQHMKAQGIRLGPAPYGYELSNQLDDKGRRVLVPRASEQEIIARLATAQAGGVGFNDIARQLNAEGIHARRGGEWTGRFASAVLQREGKHKVPPRKPYSPRVPLVHDKPAAAARARELRAEKLSLRLIGVRLRKEGLVPLRGGQWHPASVLELLRYRDPGDRDSAAAASEGATRAGAESSRSRRAAGDGRARARAWRGLVSGAGVYSFGVASRCGLTIPHLRSFRSSHAVGCSQRIPQHGRRPDITAFARHRLVARGAAPVRCRRRPGDHGGALWPWPMYSAAGRSIPRCSVAERSQCRLGGRATAGLPLGASLNK